MIFPRARDLGSQKPQRRTRCPGLTWPGTFFFTWPGTSRGARRKERAEHAERAECMQHAQLAQRAHRVPRRARRARGTRRAERAERAELAERAERAKRAEHVFEARNNAQVQVRALAHAGPAPLRTFPKCLITETFARDSVSVVWAPEKTVSVLEERMFLCSKKE